MNVFRRVFLLTSIVFLLFLSFSVKAHAAPLKENTANYVMPTCSPSNAGMKLGMPGSGDIHYTMECQCFEVSVEGGGTDTACRWVLVKVENLNSTWSNLNSGLYMDVERVSMSDGARIHQWTYTGANNQWWNTQDSGYGDGSVNMVSVNSGKCLGVGGGSITQGAPIVQWGCNGNPDQTWFWAYTGNDTSDGWPIFNVVNGNSGMCLGIGGASTQVGAYAVQWGCNGSADQEWY